MRRPAQQPPATVAIHPRVPATRATAAVLAALTPAQTLALTMWAEAQARFEPCCGWVENPIAAMSDVANVVVNRTRDPRWRRLGIKGTCLARGQFSCWQPFAAGAKRNPECPVDKFDGVMQKARQLLAGEPPGDALRACLDIARACVDGAMLDRLGGATHYHATWMVPPQWTRPPARPVAERFGHRFYASVT